MQSKTPKPYLGLVIMLGAVANPIFAFITTGVAFVILVMIIRERWAQKVPGQALTGGMAETKPMTENAYKKDLAEVIVANTIMSLV